MHWYSLLHTKTDLDTLVQLVLCYIPDIHNDSSNNGNLDYATEREAYSFPSALVWHVR